MKCEDCIANNGMIPCRIQEIPNITGGILGCQHTPEFIKNYIVNNNWLSYANWIKDTDSGKAYCSSCMAKTFVDWEEAVETNHFCYNCGAKMDTIKNRMLK